MPPVRAPRRSDPRTIVLFAQRMLREFRWTLALLMMAVLLLGTLWAVTPLAALGGHRPDPFASFFSAWMALFAQTILPAERWYLELLCGVYPLFGFGLVGEGIVRIGMLILSKERGEKEWMTVTASTYRDHIVLCGLGHLGFRILNQLLAAKEPVVALEKDANARFLGDAKATGVPVLVRDMQEDQALIDAGVQHARTIIIATNDDMANLEVALDARRMNPKIRVIMRLFDQRMADKFKEAALIDEAFSPAALAAPIVAEMALKSTTR
ncbi:MAG TPA: NAD(P)-binding protein [Polyangia bacterium]